jgi:hypothetical protein
MYKETITSISGCYASSSFVQIHTDKSIYTLQSLEGLISVNIHGFAFNADPMTILSIHETPTKFQIELDNSFITFTFAEHYKVDKTTHRSWGG